MSKRNRLRKLEQQKQNIISKTATFQKPFQTKVLRDDRASEMVVKNPIGNDNNASVASITLELIGGDLVATDTITKHSVRVPLDVNGLRVLKLMLSAKQSLPVNKQVLGSKAIPTQRMVEEFLRSKKLDEELKQEASLNELKELF